MLSMLNYALRTFRLLTPSKKKDAKGAVLIEYILLVVLLVFAAIFGLAVLGDAISDKYTDVASEIGGVDTTMPLP